MSMLIKRPGILSTVQDLGRLGWRRFGVNPNGAMDPAAARIANILVGNYDNAALVEMHFPGAEIEFERATIFSICGGDLGAQIDGAEVTPWRAFPVKAAATLRFTRKVAGERIYLAVGGGLDVPSWLGSASTNLAAQTGGQKGRPLQSGDRLEIIPQMAQGTALHRPAVSPSLLPHYSRYPTVRVITGAEFEYLSSESRDSFFEHTFTISNQANRMGFRLSGEPLALKKPHELVSAAVCFGTVQLLPDGQVIILMADQQTAGGYPRIAHIIGYDLPLVGQLGSGDKIAFHRVEITEAERLAVQFEKELSFLRVACRFANR